MNIHFNTNAWHGNTWVHVRWTTSLLFICSSFLDSFCNYFPSPSSSLMITLYPFPWLLLWPSTYLSLAHFFQLLFTFCLGPYPWPCPPSLVWLVNYELIFFSCYEILLILPPPPISHPHHFPHFFHPLHLPHLSNPPQN